MKKIVLMIITVFVFAHASEGFFIPSGFVNNVKYTGGAAQGVIDFKNMKVGESESVNYLGLLTLGDAGLQAAAAQGGIVKVVCFEQKYVSAAGFVKQRTIVYGY